MRCSVLLTYLVLLSAAAVAQTPRCEATSVSAASFGGSPLAPESIVSTFGQGLAAATESASATPLPTTLAGATVKVADSTGTERLASLFFVSPGQINHLIPAGTASGPATVTITRADGGACTGRIQVEAVGPGLFGANANGEGVAAALAVRAREDGSQSTDPVFRFDATLRRSVSAPIDLGPATDQVVLVLFGTGLRGRSSLSNVRVRMEGEETEVLYAGPQGAFVGLDQVNVRLSRSLIGRGEVDIVLTVDGKLANTVTVYLAGAAPNLPPRLVSLSPGSGEAGQTIQTLTLTGENLAGVTRLEFVPSAGITVTNLRATGAAVTAQLTIAPEAASRERALFVRTASARSNPLPFTIRAAPAPRITSLTPSAGDAGQTITTLTVAGENLAGVTAIEFSPSTGITVANLRAAATSVTAQLAIAANATAGERQVSVVSPAGRSNAVAFAIRAAAVPRITSLSPNSGEIPQTIAAFSITGENLAGVTAIEFSPAGRIAISNLRATATSVTAQLVIEDNIAAEGDRAVTVVAASGRSNSLPFKVNLRTGPFVISNLRLDRSLPGRGCDGLTPQLLPITVDFDDPTGSASSDELFTDLRIGDPARFFSGERYSPEGVSPGQTRGRLHFRLCIPSFPSNTPFVFSLRNGRRTESNRLSGRLD